MACTDWIDVYKELHHNIHQDLINTHAQNRTFTLRVRWSYSDESNLINSFIYTSERSTKTLLKYINYWEKTIPRRPFWTLNHFQKNKHLYSLIRQTLEDSIFGLYSSDFSLYTKQKYTTLLHAERNILSTSCKFWWRQCKQTRKKPNRGIKRLLGKISNCLKCISIVIMPISLPLKIPHSRARSNRRWIALLLREVLHRPG